jgi:hypothetical protein
MNSMSSRLFSFYSQPGLLTHLPVLLTGWFLIGSPAYGPKCRTIHESDPQLLHFPVPIQQDT